MTSKGAIKSSIERLEAKNETLKNIKDYILLYVDAENKNINKKEKSNEKRD